MKREAQIQYKKERFIDDNKSCLQIEAIDFKWVKPPTPLERLTQNITTALRFYYRTTTEDAASDVDDSWTEPGDGDTVGESSKFPVTALSSFVEHMEEEEGLQLIR